MESKVALSPQYRAGRASKRPLAPFHVKVRRRIATAVSPIAFIHTEVPAAGRFAQTQPVGLYVITSIKMAVLISNITTVDVQRASFPIVVIRVDGYTFLMLDLIGGVIIALKQALEIQAILDVVATGHLTRLALLRGK